MDENNVPTNEQPVSSPKKFNPIIIAVLIVVVALTGISYAFLFNKSPKEMFLQAEYNYLEHVWNEAADNYAQEIELSKKTMTEPSFIETALSGDFDVRANMSDYERQQFNNLRELIQQSQLVLESSSDPENNKYATSIAYKLNGGDVINGRLLKYDRQLGLSVPVLYDKYLVMDGSRINDIFDDGYGYYDGPNRILTLDDYKEAVNITQEDILKIGKTYSDYLMENIKEEDVTLTKGVEYESPEGQVKLKQLTLTLSEQRVHEFLKGFLETFKNDAYALDLFTESISNLAMLLGDAGYLPPNEVKDFTDRLYLKDQLRDGLDELTEAIEEINIPGGLVVALLVDRGNNIVEQKIDFALEERDEAPTVVFAIVQNLWNGKNSTDKKASIRIRPKNVDQRSEVSYYSEVRKEDNGKEGSHMESVYTVQFYDYGSEILNATAEFDTDISYETNDKTRSETDFNINANNFEVDYGTYLDRLSGKFIQVKDNKLKDGIFQNQSDVDLMLTIGNHSGKIDLSLKLANNQKMDFNKDLDFPVLNDSNSFDLTDSTQQDLHDLEWQLESSLDEFMWRHQDLFFDI